MNSKSIDILLIEDSREDIDLTKEALQERKINNRLEVVHDGEEAMNYLRECSVSHQCAVPDLIILDINIPKRNGFEVLKEIVNDHVLGKIPLIIFTVSDLTQETLAQYKIDFKQYIRKSIDFHELIDTIEKIENNDQSADAPPDPIEQNILSDNDCLDILLIEDNVEDAQLIEELLLMKQKHQWKINHCMRLNEAIKQMDHKDFDIAILDLFLPDAQGIDTLKKLVAHKPSIPVVVMTGLKGEKVGKQAIYEGAGDYLIKGQITSNRFIQSVEYAIERKKLDHLKDELLSYVNHELSNPLTVIKESISQIAGGLLGDVNEKQKHFLDVSLRNIDRLTRITEDLLLCTKLELGKLKIYKEKFSINALVHETRETFQASFSQTGLKLENILPSQDINVYADRARISQVLTNLLNNALKCTSKGCVQIVVKDKEDAVECSVIDTGQGIAANDLSKLFVKYEQLLAHKRKGKKGTGLGLYICKTLIELHGQTINVKSRLNKGTKFTFTLSKTQGDKNG